jgi:hypothetical protein
MDNVSYLVGAGMRELLGSDIAVLKFDSLMRIDLKGMNNQDQT